MKRFTFLFLITLSTIFLITSCKDDDSCFSGNGSIITKTLTVADFTGINANGSNDVIITQGNTQEVTAQGHENIIDKIETIVSGNIWDIELEDGCYKNYDLKIFITVPNLKEVSIYGSGNITINDFDNQSGLALKIEGAGNMDLNTFGGTENLILDIVGTGNITGFGEFQDLKNLDINIEGAGNYNGFLINSDDCNINIEGSGNCEVFVNDNLDVTIEGTGNVFYKGNPDITKTITGSGSIIDAN